MFKISCFLTILVRAVSTSLETKIEEVTRDEFPEPNITFPFTIMREISKGKRLEEFKEYAEGIKKRGVDMLKDLNDLIIKENGLEKNTYLGVDAAIENFQKDIQNSHNFIARLEIEFGIEDIYMFMDLLESGCKLIFLEQKKFLQHLEKKKYFSLYKNVVMVLHHKNFEQSVNFKRNELLCLCKNYDICVPYSVFTHYLEYFIDEILLLPNTEIGMIINLLSEIVRNDKNFLRLVKSDEKLVLLVKVLFTNTYNMKKSLVVMKHLLKLRHILYHAPEFKQKVRFQAVRALLDTIDRAFYFNHGEKFSVDIYDTVQAVREWGTVKENFLIDNDNTEIDLCKGPIRKFISTIFKAINFKKNDINHFFVKTLITGTLENVTSYENLFKNGFKGVYSLV